MLSDEKKTEILVQLISGAVGGALSTAASYPFSNLRLRRITE